MLWQDGHPGTQMVLNGKLGMACYAVHRLLLTFLLFNDLYVRFIPLGLPSCPRLEKWQHFFPSIYDTPDGSYQFAQPRYVNITDSSVSSSTLAIYFSSSSAGLSTLTSITIFTISATPNFVSSSRSAPTKTYVPPRSLEGNTKVMIEVSVGVSLGSFLSLSYFCSITFAVIRNRFLRQN